MCIKAVDTSLGPVIAISSGSGGRNAIHVWKRPRISTPPLPQTGKETVDGGGNNTWLMKDAFITIVMTFLMLQLMWFSGLPDWAELTNKGLSQWRAQESACTSLKDAMQELEARWKERNMEMQDVDLIY
jgi:hypothetical protein